MEVVSWTGEDLSSNADGGIERFILTNGDGYSSPNEGALVDIHLVGKYEGKVFEERNVSFTIGEASEANVVRGVNHALKKFKKGEQSRLTLKPAYAFGKEGSKEFNIPPDAQVEFIVTLKSFEKAKESWTLDEAERIEQAQLFKEKGTNYFKAGKYQLAIKIYKKIQSFLDTDKGKKHS